ncbi:YadA-like family protein [Rodentibacter haemolyticus]|uniref:YadA-like family protein n=1 Tax=Rodentibacter haemolyticus TaxID=2778911 RepID=A0ABX6UYS7_9PAST|nr:YadA-like family protein [Rodentibacter haemolyticus]QPB43238.1 YadA-like family protein [Rodentibacter haemolyticus]
MNKIFKVVFNHALGVWVAVSELAKGYVKSSRNSVNDNTGDTKLNVFSKESGYFKLSMLSLALFVTAGLIAEPANAVANLAGNTADSGHTGTIVIGAYGEYKKEGASTYGNRADTYQQNPSSGPQYGSIAIGGYAAVSGVKKAIAYGHSAKVTGGPEGGIALGANSQVSAAASTEASTKSLTINGTTYTYAGQPTSSTAQLSIGNGNLKRQITNVAAGRVSESSTDAINGSQLYAVVKAINGLNATSGGLSNFIVGADKNHNATGINVTKDANRFDVISADEKYLTTKVNGTSVEIDLNASAKNAINQVANNTQNITKNAQNISNNAQNITKNVQNISNNTQNITKNAQDIAKGFGLKAADGQNVTHKLGNPIEVVGGNSNINTTVDGGKVKINLNNTLDLSKTGSVKTGDTTLNNTGLTISGGPSVTKNGINAGNQKITNVSNGTNPNDAVNFSQLNATNNNVTNLNNSVNNINATVNKGWNINTSKSGTGNVSGNKQHNIKMGDTVTIDAGDNINITQASGQISIATSKTPNFTSVDTGSLTVRPNGNVNFGGNVLQNVGKPTNNTDAANKKYVDDGRTIVTSKDKSVTINVSGTDQKTYDLSVNVTSTTPDFKYKGDNNTSGSNKLSEAITFQGSDHVKTTASNGTVTFDLTDTAKTQLKKEESVNSTSSNVIVTENGKNSTGGKNYSVSLNNTLDLTDAGSVKAGNTLLNNTGLTISGGPSVTQGGINAGSKKITNVSNGTDPNDAVNFSQLNATNNNVTNLNNTVNNVNATVNKGWNISTTASAGGNVSGNKNHNVKMGDTVTIDAGKNINITQSNGKISIATSDTPNFTGVSTQNLTVRPNGNIDFGNNVLHNVAAPTADTGAANKKYVDDGRTTVNSTDKSVNVTANSANPKNYDLSVNMSKVANDVTLKYSADSGNGTNKLAEEVKFKGSDYVKTTAKNGEVAFDLSDNAKNKINNAIQNFTVGADKANTAAGLNITNGGRFDIVGAENNYIETAVSGNNITVGLNSTAVDSIKKAQKGFGLKAQDGANVTHQLGEAIEVVGGNSNINTTIADGKVKVNLNNTLDLTKDGKITIGNSTLNDNGLTITNGPSVTKEGINAGNKNITNVANGTNATDAVNLSQLNASKTEVKQGKNVVVSNETAADGHTIYTVNANASSVSKGSDNVTVTGEYNATTGITDYKVDLSEQAKKDLAKEESVSTDSSNLNVTVNATQNAKGGKDYIVRLNNTLNLTKDGSVTIGDTKLDNSGLTINGGPSVTKEGINAGNKNITNVANGTNATDAVNLSQLNASTAAAKTEVKQGNNVIVNSTKDADGHTIYTVHANTSSVSNGSDKVTVTGNYNATTGITDYSVDLSKAAKDQLAKEESVSTDSANLNVSVNATKNTTGGNDYIVRLNNTLNLTENGSVTIGDTKLDNNGLTINGGPNVTKDGINAGDKKITNVTNGTLSADSKDAVNGSQLYATNQNITNVTNEVAKGWNITTSGNAVNSTVHNVKMGETVTIDAGSNINITQNNGNISISTSDTPTFSNITVKDGKDGQNGASVVINGKDGSIGLTGPKGADGANGTSATIKVVNGTKGLDGNDGVNGESKTRIEYVKPDGTKEEIATLKDGLKFKGDNAQVINRTLNSQLDIVGGAKEANLTANNIGVVGHANGTMEVKLNKDLNLTDKGSISIGNTTLNNDGLTINGGPNITQGGIDAGNKKITNVADGNVTKDSKDAVNGGQLYSVIAETGFNLASKVVENTTGAVSEATGLDAAGKRILTNETFNLDAGNNIVIKQIKDGYEVATAENVTFTNITVGKDGKDGTIGVNGKDGTGVVLNGKDGVIGINGKDGVSANITVANGTGTLDADDKGGKGITRIVYNTTNADGSTTTREVATKDDGLVFKGDNGDAIKKKLGETLNITGGVTEENKLTDNNIGVVNKDGNLTVKLNKDLNLTDNGSVTIGGTTLNKEGLTINDGPSIHKDGINAGDKKITNVTNGTLSADSKDAVNGSQLYATNQNVTNVTNEVGKGWNITTSKSGSGNVANSTLHNVKMGETVTLDAGNNINITQTNGTISISTSDTPTFSNITVKDGKDGKDGASVVINGKDGSIGLTGPKGANGKNGASANISVAEGQTTVNPKDNGQNITRIVYNTTDASGNTVTREVATMDDGLKFKGDNDTIINRTLGSQLNITGGVTDTANLTDNNIGVVGNANGDLVLKLNKNLNLTKDGSLAIGNSTLNDGGLTINGGPSIKTDGINAGDKKITNVAAGDINKDSKDAVNGGQLYSVIANTGFNLASKQVAGTNGASSEAENLAEGDKRIVTNETFNLDAGNNIVIKQIKDGYEVATAENVTFTNITVGKDGKDGTIGVNGANGTGVVLNGKDGSIGIKGKDGASANITVANGTGTLDENGKGGDGITRIVYNTTNSDGSVTTREVATKDDGLVFKGDNGEAIKKKLGETLNITGGVTEADKLTDNNIGVVNKDGNLTVKLSKDLNLTDKGSITIGDANLSNGGLTINGGPSINKDGINAGDKKITNVADGNVSNGSKEAINGGQLYAAITNSGFSLTTKAVANSNGEASAEANLSADDKRIANNETFTLDAGNNLVIKQIANGYQIATSSNMTIGKDGKDGVDGRIGVNGKDGASVVINGKDGSIGLTGPKGENGKDGASANITVANGTGTLDETGKGGEGITRIVYNTTNADGTTTTREIATKDDGLVFKGDNGEAIKKKLGETLNITGGVTDDSKLTDNNIGVVNKNGNLTVKLNKDLNLTDKGSVTIGDVNLSNGGLSINGGPSISKDGINAGDKKITNVTNGTLSADSKEAVNGSQLYATNQNVTNITNEVGKGWNITTSKSGSGNVANSTLHNVKMGDTVTLDAGNNINITQTNGTISISTSDTPNFANVTVGKDGKDGVDGTIGVNGKDGASVVINGKDGSIGLTGPKGADGKAGASANITVKDGSGTLDEANKGGDGITRLVYNTTNADGSTTTREIATKDDGLVFKGDNGEAIKKKLGETLNITGGVTDDSKLTDNNIGVVNKDGNLTVKLSKDLNLTDKGSVTIGNVSISSGGIDLGNTTITNLSGNLDKVNNTTTSNPDQNGNKYENITNNAATVGDVLNAGWNLQANGKAVDFVTHGNTVNFNNGTGVAVNAVYNATTGATNITFNTTNSYVDENGALTNTPSNKVRFIGANNSAPVLITNVDSGVLPQGTSLPANVTFNEYLNNLTGPALNNVVNAGDLKNATQNITKDTLSAVGFNLKSAVVAGSNGAASEQDGLTEADKRLTNNETFNLNAGNNIVIKQIANGYEVATSNNITVGAAGKNGKDGIDGTIGVNGKDGSAVVINGKDGSIGLNGKDGANGLTIKGGQGPAGVNGKDGETTTRIQYVVNGTTENVANLNDGLKFKGDNDQVINRTLNSQLNIVGGAQEANLTANNIGVIGHANGTMEVKLNKDLNLTKDGSVTLGNTTLKDGNFTMGNVTMNNDGLTIKDGPSITNKGIDGGNKTITNIANGTNATDAVNLQQLNASMAAAKTELVEGKNVNITSSVGADKQTIYTVNAEKSVVTGSNAVNVATTVDKANFTTSYNIDLSEEMKKQIAKEESVTAGDSNIKVVANGTNASGGKNFDVSLNKDLNLSKDGSVTIGGTSLKDGNVTIGNTTLNNDGLTIKNGPSITSEGINAGNKKVTNVADGDISPNSKEAINGGQLYTSIANSGFNLATNGEVAGTDKRINNNETFTLNQGKNIIVKQIDNGYEVSTTNNFVIGEKGEPGKDGVDGTIGVNGKDGSSVVINGKDGSIGLTGPKGADGKNASATVRVIDGQKGLDGNDGKDGESKTRIEYTKQDGSKEQVATLNDGLEFMGDSGTVSKQKLNSRVNVVGGQADESKLSSAANIGVVSDGKGKLTVKLAKDIDLGKDGSVAIGNTTVNNNGVVIKGSDPKGRDTVSVTDKGISAGNKVISNVAPGVKPTDAVNKGQLDQVRGDIHNVNNRVDNLDKRVRGIGANAAAASSLPQVYMPGKSMVAAAAGGYSGASAIAVGYSRSSDNGKVILKLTGTANSAGHYSGGVGVGYQW